MYKTVKPFIKWAGGKSQLLKDIRKKYPDEIRCYCEPFVGGGAVLFDVLVNFQPEEILINDINSELINTYIQIKNNVEDLIFLLFDMQKTYWNIDQEQRKKYFYEVRKRFNYYILNKSKADTEKAGLFIFLNKTCFNGLYRVNAKGEFNVPVGSYKNPLICDVENLKLISKLLKNVQIKCGDYSKCAGFIDNNTFVYIDPPYRPISETASFNSYTKNKFGDEEQIKLARFIDIINDKGAKVIASNSDPKNTDINDNFFDDLYSSYSISRVTAKRMINSKSNDRGFINELLICNY